MPAIVYIDAQGNTLWKYQLDGGITVFGSNRWVRGRFTLDGNHLFILGTFNSNTLKSLASNIQPNDPFTVIYKVNLVYIQ
jgi:hypothetical protein